MTRLQSSLATTLLAVATTAAGAQALPPIRPLPPVEHASKDLLGAVSAVRALPDGRVIVNDLNGRKAVLFDKTLSSFTVIADTTSATGNAYSSRAAGIIAYRGDSTLFVDPVALSMLVIDPNGKITRVMSVPRPNDAEYLIGGPSGTPGFDPAGRLVYQAAAPQIQQETPQVAGGHGAQAAGGHGAQAAGGHGAQAADGHGRPGQFPDSGAIVRVELATRRVDTVGKIKVLKLNMSMSQDANGRMTRTSIMNPMPQVDDWAILADGSVALVRGQDYHVDWVRPHGSKSSSPKIPFQWRHLSDSDKVAFIDSTKKAMEAIRTEALAAHGVADGHGAGRQAPAIPALTFISPSELPDYAPPFTAGSARGDADGNLWIRTSIVVNGGSVYDVINAKGELIDRVQVPRGRVIAGFGKGGVVYMGVREAAGTRLEQARVR